MSAHFESKAFLSVLGVREGVDGTVADFWKLERGWEQLDGCRGWRKPHIEGQPEAALGVRVCLVAHSPGEGHWQVGRKQVFTGWCSQ